MSDLPPGYSDLPPGSSGPPRSGDLFDPGLPPPGRDPEAAKRRVLAPAIFLIVVGVLNLLVGGILLFDAFAVKSDPAAIEAQVDQQWSTMPADQLNELHQKFGSTHDIVSTLGNGFLWGGGLSVIVGVLGILGGIRMLSLRSYGLGVVASILTAIPCVSPCCLIGQIAGIWALIVLLNGEVRSAFR